MVMTTSGISQSDVTPASPSIFALVKGVRYKEAYALLCPSVRAVTDYRAFATALGANPFLRFNDGFQGTDSRTVVGSGVQSLSGWVVTVAGTVPAVLTLGMDGDRPCLLGGQVAGQPILPPFGMPGPPPPAAGWYLTADQLMTALSDAELSGASVAGARFVMHHHHDGTRDIDLTLPSGQTMKDTGPFRVDGNRVCGSWRELNGGQEVCTRWLLRPDGIYEVYDVEDEFLQSRMTRIPLAVTSGKP
jgi:hypothetical protein